MSEGSRAIITGVLPYGDADLIVRLFTEDQGRITAFARAAKRSKKRFGGSLTALARGRAELGKRRRGSDLFTLKSFEAEPSLFGLAEPEIYGRAAYLVEITERLLGAEDIYRPLFVTLSMALELLARGAADARHLRGYELRLLAASGYLPDLGRASDIEGQEPVALDKTTGALVAESTPDTVPFSRGARHVCEALLHDAFLAPPEVEDDRLREVGRLFALHLRRMGIVDLKSVAFLRSLHVNFANPR